MHGRHMPAGNNQDNQGNQDNQEQPSGPECSDTPPSNEFTCQEQQSFGKCDAEWMLSGAARCSRQGEDGACGSCLWSQS